MEIRFVGSYSDTVIFQKRLISICEFIPNSKIYSADGHGRLSESEISSDTRVRRYGHIYFLSNLFMIFIKQKNSVQMSLRFN